MALAGIGGSQLVRYSPPVYPSDEESVESDEEDPHSEAALMERALRKTLGWAEAEKEPEKEDEEEQDEETRLRALFDEM